MKGSDEVSMQVELCMQMNDVPGNGHYRHTDLDDGVDESDSRNVTVETEGPNCFRRRRERSDELISPGAMNHDRDATDGTYSMIPRYVEDFIWSVRSFVR